MPPIVQLSDRLWLNLDQVLYAEQRPGALWIVQLAHPGPEGNGRLTPAEAAELLRHLRAGPPEEAPGEGDWVETWGLVEHNP